MNAVTIEILPKSSFRAAMTQSPEDAIDVGDFKTGYLQAWVDRSGADTVDLTLQQSNVNEDSAFGDVSTLTVDDAFSAPGDRADVTISARFVRLKITPSMGAAALNVRAVLHLNRA